MEREFCPYCMSRIQPGEPCPSCGLTEGAYTPLSHHLPPGTVLAGRYLVGRVLGEGGFGITYIGCDLRLELKVAIKEFYPGDKVTRNSAASLSVSSYTGAIGQGYEASRARFIKEARAMARMDKTPQIVAVRDFFEENNTAYIVMEYVDGTTFKELVNQKGGKLSSKELLPLVEPLFTALSSMHKLGLIHRDISPDNLMLENGCVRLLDFGCARESGQGNATMTIVLKHGYSPVEQYQHKGQGPWTDVYSLAATLYFCLTGATPPQALDRICDEELIPPRQLGADLTPAQERAILKGMGVRHSQRFSSVEEFRAALFDGVGMDAERPEELPVTEEAPATGELPAAGEVPAAEEVSVEEDLPEPRQDAPPRVKKASWPIVGGVTAAVLCMGLLVWRPWAGKDPGPVPGPGESVSPSQSAAPGESPPASPSPPASSKPKAAFHDYSSETDNGRVFLDLLADDSCEEIKIPANVWVRLDESVTLAKPLFIGKQAGVNFTGGLTVAQGGSVRVLGDLNSDILLRIVDGGTVSVEDGGHLYCPMVWQAREGGLTATENGHVDVWGTQDPTKGEIDSYARSHYWLFDEEDLFAGAVHVATEEEFVRNCQGSAPVVLDRDLTLSQPHFSTVPIRVPEGITLDAPCPDGFSGSDRDCTLTMEHGAILVNHGTVTGRVKFDGIQRNNGQWQDNDPCLLVNFGTFDANLLGEMSAVLNLGTMTTREILRNTALHNLGSLTLDGLLEMRGNHSVNSGTLTIAGGGVLTVYGNTGWNNFGGITVADGGQLRNMGQFNLVSGRLTVESGGRLDNTGTLRDEGTIQAEPGAELVNSGVVVDSGTLSREIFEGEGRVLSLQYDSDQTRHVSSESELRAALEDDAVDLVVWDGYDPNRKIDLNGGPLTVTKGLVLRGGQDSRPELNSGGLTLSGEDAFLLGDNLDFRGHGLILEGGTALLDGDTLGLGGDIRVDGGLLCIVGGAQMPDPGKLDLRNGGIFVLPGGIELGRCALSVDQDSSLQAYGNLGLLNCSVTNRGRIEVTFADLYQEGGSLVNYGSLGLDGWEGIVSLGDVTNHGQINIGGRQNIFGTLVNEADGEISLEWEDCPLRVFGRLENRGLIRAADGAYVETVDGGVFTGNQVTGLS